MDTLTSGELLGSPHDAGGGGGGEGHLVALQGGLAAEFRGPGQALTAAAAPRGPEVGTEGVLF